MKKEKHREHMVKRYFNKISMTSRFIRLLISYSMVKWLNNINLVTAAFANMNCALGNIFQFDLRFDNMIYYSCIYAMKGKNVFT